MNTTSPDYLAAARYVLPTHRQTSVIEQGAIGVSGDTITAVDTLDALRSKFPETEVIWEEHGLIMPGLINTHTHAAMSCLRGLADDLPLMDWLEKHIFPIEAELSAEMVFQSTLLSIAEMIRSGTTSFCDMYLFSKEVARAVDSTGIRGWVGEVLYDFPSPCYGEMANGIAYLQEMFAEYQDNELVTITTDPHSVYTCSPDLLTRLGALAEENNSLYVIHLSENDVEVDTCRQRYGLRPVEHLDNLGLLGSNTLASHCVKLTTTDMELLSKRQVSVAHCVESNMKLASGLAPTVEMLRHGINVSLGTDGSASNNDVDMFSEMNSVAQTHKARCMDPTVMNAETTLAAATIGGAHALGRKRTLGTLEVGKKADFIVLDLDQPHMVPLYNLPSHLTYVARGSDVIHSYVNGRPLMKNRQLLTIDESKLLATMRKMAKNIVELRN
ncbi:MAG: amidohydrolase [Desulfocapsaceae bacterium]|nr:amidohydrolase [Desulfocapsaceae bacterium]